MPGLSNIPYTFILALVIIVLWFYSTMTEKFTDPAYQRVSDVISAVNSTVKVKGKLSDFKEFLGDKNFDPMKFVRLMDLHRHGNLVREEVEKIL